MRLQRRVWKEIMARFPIGKSVSRFLSAFNSLVFVVIFHFSVLEDQFSRKKLRFSRSTRCATGARVALREPSPSLGSVESDFLELAAFFEGESRDVVAAFSGRFGRDVPAQRAAAPCVWYAPFFYSLITFNYFNLT